LNIIGEAIEEDVISIASSVASEEGSSKGEWPHQACVSYLWANLNPELKSRIARDMTRFAQLDHSTMGAQVGKYHLSIAELLALTGNSAQAISLNLINAYYELLSLGGIITFTVDGDDKVYLSESVGVTKIALMSLFRYLPISRDIIFTSGRSIESISLSFLISAYRRFGFFRQATFFRRCLSRLSYICAKCFTVKTEIILAKL